MTEFPVPPALILLAAGLLVGPMRGTARGILLTIAPLLALLAVWNTADGVQLTLPFLGYSLEILEGSAGRRLLGSAFVIALLCGNWFALRRTRWWELTAAQLYAAGALGAVFAGDLISLFLFWEIMAVFAVALVWCGGDEAARAAGIRYAILHLLGAMLLKLGIEATKLRTGSIDLQPLALDNGASWLLLAGLLVNTAVAPLSVWLTDACPRSTPTGSVFLIPFTTVTAALALMQLFPGELPLIGIGLWMMLHGLLYALAQNRPRRLITYAALAQIGFMLCGIGLGHPLADNGVIALAAVHTVSFTLLMMSASATLLLPEGDRGITSPIRYAAPWMPWCALMGLLTLAALPLTGGYTARLLILEAAPVGLWIALQIAMAGNALVALRLGWLLRSRILAALPAGRASRGMAVALALLAALCLLPGLLPGIFYQQLPHFTSFNPYAIGSLLTQLQLLLFAVLAGALLLTRLDIGRKEPADFDWLWRVAGFHIARWTLKRLARIRTRAITQWLAFWQFVNGRRWPEAAMSYRSINGMIFWAVLTLLVLVLAKVISTLPGPVHSGFF